MKAILQLCVCVFLIVKSLHDSSEDQDVNSFCVSQSMHALSYSFTNSTRVCACVVSVC